MLGAPRALLFSPTPHAASFPGATVDLPDSILTDYATTWHEHDIWTHRINQVRGLESSQIIVGEAVVLHQEFTRSLVFNECLCRHGIGRLMTAAVVPRTRRETQPVTVCSFYRSAEQEAFGTIEVATYRHLVTHLVQAMRTFWILQKAESSEQLYRGAFEEASDAVFCVHEDGSVHASSTSAERFLVSHQFMKLANGRLEANGHPSNARFLATLMNAAQEGRPLTVVLVDGARLPALTLTTVNLPSRLRDGTTMTRIRSMILLRRATGHPKASAALLREAYSLTSAEERLVAQLMAGLSPREVGDQLGITLNTVRTQLKSIYSKTQSRGLYDLLILISRFRT